MDGPDFETPSTKHTVDKTVEQFTRTLPMIKKPEAAILRVSSNTMI